MRHCVSILLLYVLFAVLYATGEFLGCYYLIPGSAEWCELILLQF